MTDQEKITLTRLINLRLILDRYEDTKIAEMMRVFNAAQANILNRLGDVTIRNRTQLNNLLSEIDLVSTALETRLTGNIAMMTAESGSYTYDEMNKILGWDGRVNSFNALLPQMDSLFRTAMDTPIGGHTLAPWVSKTLGVNSNALKIEVTASIASGDSYKAMVSRLGTKFRNIPEEELITLARTYTQSIQVRAQEDIFDANSDIVKSKEWSAILEVGYSKTGRGTCERCAALDGNRYKLKDPDNPNMPLHPRCRCIWSPQTLTWREMGLDVDEMKDIYQPVLNRYNAVIGTGRTGSPEVLMMQGGDYEQAWLRMGNDNQNNVIGVVRANLVRNGSLPFKSIVDGKGNLIPIDKLGLSNDQLKVARKREN